MSTAIIGIGTANPIYKRSQMETAELICSVLDLKQSEKRLLKSIYKASGVDYRHSVLKDYSEQPGRLEFFPNDSQSSFPSTAARMNVYQQNALPLALTAINDCLSYLENFNLKDITHLITISCTGMYAPGLDIEIAHQLNLRTTIQRTAINFMGCYGVFNGIKLADAICKSSPNAKVLLVSVEICTIHFKNKFHLDNLISNSLFSDGAAAILIEANSSQKKYFLLNGFHCDLLPQTNHAMAWRVVDDGFDIVLSTYVPEAIRSGIAAFSNTLLNSYELIFSDIDFFAIHPGGIKILEACETALNISKEQNNYSYDTLRQFGNMSSATVLFVLKKIWNNLTHYDHNKNIFSCAFGPGLTLESMLLRTHFN